METIRPSAVTEEVNSPTTSQEASYSPAKEMRDRRGCRSENLRIWPTLPREEFTGPLGAHAYIQQCIRILSQGLIYFVLLQFDDYISLCYVEECLDTLIHLAVHNAIATPVMFP